VEKMKIRVRERTFEVRPTVQEIQVRLKEVLGSFFTDPEYENLARTIREQQSGEVACYGVTVKWETKEEARSVSCQCMG
jgi:hypothetical protein